MIDYWLNNGVQDITTVLKSTTMMVVVINSAFSGCIVCSSDPVNCIYVYVNYQNSKHTFLNSKI